VSAPGPPGSALPGWNGTDDGAAQGCDEDDRDAVSARKALRQALKPTVVRPRAPRPLLYGEDVIVALRLVWAVMDAPAAKRMAPFLPEIVDRATRSANSSSPVVCGHGCGASRSWHTTRPR